MHEDHLIENRIEEYIRTQFSVSPSDPGFGPEADLFEEGYVDSVGIVELLEFLGQEFAVEIAEEDLLSDDFSTLYGIARIVRKSLGEQDGSASEEVVEARVVGKS